MSSKFVILLFISVASSEITAPGIDRSYSDGVKSVGYSVIYGDEDMTIINQAVSDAEKSSMLKSRVNLNEAIAPLPSQDVKCLMSVDRYCSKEMLQTKGNIFITVQVFSTIIMTYSCRLQYPLLLLFAPKVNCILIDLLSLN